MKMLGVLKSDEIDDLISSHVAGKENGKGKLTSPMRPSSPKDVK
jgi:hypothetical protein